MAQRLSVFDLRICSCALVTVLSMSFAQSAEQLSSSTKIAADPRAAYLTIKSIMKNDVRTKWTPTDQICPSDIREKKIRVLCCTGYIVFYVKGPLRRALIEIAYNVLRTQSAMSANRIPARYWQAPLLEYEESALRAIKERRYTVHNKDSPEYVFIELKGVSFPRLIETIKNSMRSDGRLDVDISVGECGGPSNQITIKTSPPGGIVYLLPRIFYLYCKQQGDDVDNVKQCDHWFPPIHTPEEVYVGGVYRYRIEWPNNRSSVSEFDADRYSSEVTLR